VFEISGCIKSKWIFLNEIPHGKILQSTKPCCVGVCVCLCACSSAPARMHHVWSVCKQHNKASAPNGWKAGKDQAYESYEYEWHHQLSLRRTCETAGWCGNMTIWIKKHELYEICSLEPLGFPHLQQRFLFDQDWPGR
jgi:hypothetical protein